jgi:hypothetical protein
MRRPLVTDKRQLFSFWRVEANPTTGVEGEFWYLAKYESNGNATWVMLAGGSPSTGGVLTLSDTAGTLVQPTVAGNIQLKSSDATVSIIAGTNTLDFKVAGGMAADSFPTNSGTAAPVAGVLNVLGTNAANTTGSGNTVTVNAVNVCRFIVDATVTRGTHTTIALAITAAVAAGGAQNIFIRPGTYTEDLTLPASINLISFVSDGDTPTVIISGKVTMTTAGTSCISGIRLQTNSDFFLAVTGSAASIVNLENCYLNCLNNTGISFTSSSASSRINIDNCIGNLATTGIALFAASGAGSIIIDNTLYSNTGVSLTASTISSGNLISYFTQFPFPITTSSTGFVTARYSVFAGANVTALNLNNTANNSFFTNCIIGGGTSSAISVGASASAAVLLSEINSSNTNAITGSGSISIDQLTFTGASNTINTTTVVGLVSQNGVFRSSTHPAFSAYLAAAVNDKTGNGATYKLGTDALTEVYDNGSNFNTNGTFTAPYTGRYHFNAAVSITGCTIATAFVLDLVTTLRTYRSTFNRAASANGQQLLISIDADMNATDTAIVNVIVAGEAADTDDINGSGVVLLTYFCGHLIC